MSEGVTVRERAREKARHMERGERERQRGRERHLACTRENPLRMGGDMNTMDTMVQGYNGYLYLYPL